MFCFDARKNAAPIVPAAFLILSLAFAAQAQTISCQNQCRSDCEDSAIGKPAIAACIAKCDQTRCQPPPPVLIHPRYLILSLLYAPPGCSNTSSADKCNPQGSVSYGANSSNGTKVSASSSFQSGNTVEVGTPVASESQGFQITTTDSTSETVTKTKGLILATTGTQDGVNHDLDQFVLLTDPVVTIQQTSSATLWSLAGSGGSFNLLPVTVGELKNPSTMPQNLAKQFAALGFTNSDYQTILAQDPFAYGGISVDPSQYSNRYTHTGLQLGYTPPDPNSCTGGLCPCVSSQYPISNTSQGTIGASVQAQYSVGYSEGSLEKTGLVSKTSFTWTINAALENTVSGSQTANLTLACPSPAYTGPVEVDVYWDALYGSFLFAPLVDGIQVQQGTVTTTAGKPLQKTPVVLAYGGRTYLTFTDYRGRYRFAVSAKARKSMPATGELSVNNVRQPVELGSSSTTQIRVPQI